MRTAFVATAVMMGLLGRAAAGDMKVGDMAKVGDVMISRARFICGARSTVPAS